MLNIDTPQEEAADEEQEEEDEEKIEVPKGRTGDSLIYVFFV